jgi:hypothetical protein
VGDRLAEQGLAARKFDPGLCEVIYHISDKGAALLAMTRKADGT